MANLPLLTRSILRSTIFLLGWMMPLLQVHGLVAQSSDPVFEYLSDKDGLAQNHVFHITQDQEGFMWFSTMDGLSKYDGFTFTNYYHARGDTTTLTSSYVNAFYQDRQGRCWVATHEGFNEWDRYSAKATRYYHNDALPHSIGHDQVRSIIEDKAGNLWIAHMKGLDRFDPQTKRFIHYYHPHFSVSRHSGFLAIHPDGSIWAVGVHGLFKIDQDSLHFVKELPQSYNFPPHEGRDIHIDHEGRIWVGYKNGFALYQPESNTYEVFTSGMFQNGVIKILSYDSQTLAIATGGGGLHLWDIASRKTIRRFVHNPFDEYSIRGLSVYTMYVDRVKNIWIGLFYGISMTNLETQRFTWIRHGHGFANYANFALRVYKDVRGGIWTNTMAGLFYQPNPQTPSKEFIRNPAFPPGYKRMSCITGDTKGNVYFAFRSVGLYQYSYTGDRLSEIDIGSVINADDVTFLHVDQRDDALLWICSTEGLQRFHTSGGESRLILPADLNHSLLSNAITRLTQDVHGNFYFINSGKICRFTPPTEKVEVVPATDPIEGTIWGIDIRDSLLWIGTSEAVYRYNTNTNLVTKIKQEDGSFLTSNGLLADEHGVAWSVVGRVISRITGDSIRQYNSQIGYVTGIGSRAPDGNLLFGGDNGIIEINPSDFYTDTTLPTVIFTGYDIANQRVELWQESEFVEEIHLQPDDRVFTLHYAALHFNHREGIRYFYRLDGFNTDWISAGHSRSVTYTNLSPGLYSFRVIAETEDGIRSNPLSLSVRIHAAFYQTSWFRVLVILLGAGILLAIYRQRQKTIQLKKEKVLAEQQTAYKSMFLANMSHEIRTPLNAIMGLNHLMLQTPMSATQKEYTDVIKASCENLLWIVNDILDQSKIESGTYIIESRPFDPNDVLHHLELLFRHQALVKNLSFHFTKYGDIPATLVGDPVRLIQILSNLLHNAIKFTDTGSVKLEARFTASDSQNVASTFTITDTGIGIPEEKISAIFESFQQINEKVIPGNQGTGLGLSIVKYLTDKMGGTIEIQSVHGKGSTCIVHLPFSRVMKDDVNTAITHIVSTNSVKSGLKILLVEDAPINQMVTTALIQKWLNEATIDLAENGEEAVAKATHHEYDIILMDIKMPVMDGIEATRRIRALPHPTRRHVAIAGLSANVIPQQMEVCTKAGMNVFIGKPIQKDDFLEKIAPLL